MKRFLLYAFLFLSLSYSLFPQADTTYWIAPTGNDSNYGTDPNKPLAKINAALNKIPNPLTYSVYICVKPGNYNQVVNINKSGNAEYPIIIKLYNEIPSECGDDNDAYSNMYNGAIFYGSDNTIFSNAQAVFNWSDSLDYITIDGIKIKNVTANDNLAAAIWIRGNHNSIINCELDSIKRTGIQVQGSYNSIKGNNIYNILGGSNSSYKGNSISIEGYCYNNKRRNSEHNIIANNIIRNNPTHFGINIFPATNDSTQPFMLGNKIYGNYIENTGGGIYTRYQKDFEITGNVIVNNHGSTYWDIQGGGILFGVNDSFPKPLPVDEANIKIYNNTIADNDNFGIENNTSNNLFIKNNILSNNGSLNIVFQNFTINNPTHHIDNNLYYGSSQWRWGTDTNETSLASWRLVSGQDAHGLNCSPLFYGQGNYKIIYGSPAKNAGAGLREEGVITDFENNPRPYWNKDYDIGAYEVQGDAQIKIGIVGDLTNPVFKLSSIGTYWEHNNSGSFIISQNAAYGSSSVTVASADTNKNNWKGWDFGWLNTGVSDSNKAFAHGIYKLSYTSDTSKYFYIDYRDAVANYSPNLYILYNSTLSIPRFQIFENGTFSGNEIENGSILRLWLLNNGDPNTNGLENFWDNALVWLNSNNHPQLVWGPYESSSGTIRYNISREDNVDDGYQLLTSISSYNYLDGSKWIYNPEGIQYPHYTAHYKIDAVVGKSTFPSNQIAIDLNGYNLEKDNHINNLTKPLEYGLIQNYPNPFNPVTTIKYSISNNALVKLQIFDILGREVKTLVNEEKPTGEYEVKFNGSGLASGVYFYKLTAGPFTQTRKMQLLK